MTATGKPRRAYARLSFKDGEVVVMPRDNNIFLISAQKAIEACENAVKRDEQLDVFESQILIPLHDWCVAHADQVIACYIPTPGRHLQVFIVSASTMFDFELAEEIASLELKLAQSGWRIGVSQLPNSDDESLGTFFSSEGALEVYAHSERTPQESGRQP